MIYADESEPVGLGDRFLVIKDVSALGIKSVNEKDVLERTVGAYGDKYEIHTNGLIIKPIALSVREFDLLRKNKALVRILRYDEVDDFVDNLQIGDFVYHELAATKIADRYHSLHLAMNVFGLDGLSHDKSETIVKSECKFGHIFPHETNHPFYTKRLPKSSSNPYPSFSASSGYSASTPDVELPNSDLYCDCSAPDVVVNTAAGKDFEFCRKCKKEKI
jgi:hypothetical protein